MHYLIIATVAGAAGATIDFLGFLSDHWQAIGQILAIIVLLAQQWRTAHAAKTAADAAKVAVTVAVKADGSAKERDQAASKILKLNTVATLNTEKTTKAIEQLANGEKSAREAHIEVLEGLLRAAGKDVPPKPPILG